MARTQRIGRDVSQEQVLSWIDANEDRGITVDLSNNGSRLELTTPNGESVKYSISPDDRASFAACLAVKTQNVDIDGVAAGLNSADRTTSNVGKTARNVEAMQRKLEKGGLDGWLGAIGEGIDIVQDSIETVREAPPVYCPASTPATGPDAPPRGR